MNRSAAKIENLTGAQRGVAVDVFADAFRDYPVMRYVIGDGRADYDVQLGNLIGYYCDKRFVNGWPVLGLRLGGEIVGLASVSPPVDGDPEKVARLEADLRAAMGEEAFARMVRFERICDALEPPEPYHYLGMLGVRPGHQGGGHGKALLRRVQELAVEAGTAGVCLSTEDPKNVPLYEHLGFKIVAEADVETLHTWCLRWPNPGFTGTEAG